MSIGKLSVEYENPVFSRFVLEKLVFTVFSPFSKQFVNRTATNLVCDSSEIGAASGLKKSRSEKANTCKPFGKFPASVIEKNRTLPKSLPWILPRQNVQQTARQLRLFRIFLRELAHPAPDSLSLGYVVSLAISLQFCGCLHVEAHPQLNAFWFVSLWPTHFFQDYSRLRPLAFSLPA